MMKYFSDIRQKLLKKVDAHGLAVFRMFYVLVLFSELSQLKRFSQIIYNEAPFLAQLEFSSIAVFVFWQVILVFLFFGLFTRFTTIVNYIFSILVFSFLKEYEYHVFYAYVGINFFLLFMPVSRVLSLDSLIEKIKYSNVGKFYKPDPKVYAFNYFIPVFVGVGIVYFDSMFYKVTSNMWLSGLGMWKPANIPFATWFNMTPFMNNEFIVRFLGYLVMVFETLFIFTMWFKRFRLPMFFIGVGFHIGILICYPIPWFALTAIALYVLMIPAGFWKRLNFRFGTSNFTFYYDYECPLCIKTVTVIKHLDVFGKIECKTVQSGFKNDPLLKGIEEQELLSNIYSTDSKGNIYKGYNTYIQLLINMIYTAPFGLIMKLPVIRGFGERIYAKIAEGREVQRCTADTCHLPVYNAPLANDAPILVSWITKDFLTRKLWKFLIIFTLILQCIVSLFSAYPSNFRRMLYSRFSIEKSFEHKLKKTLQPIVTNSREYLGIANHPVFMDGHFDNYNHILKINYVDKDQEITLPIINNEGMPGSYIRGAFWVNFTFRVSSPNFEIREFNAGIKRYIMYWLKSNKKDLAGNHNFKVYVKEIEIPQKWEKDFLNNQIAKPWKFGGNINLNNGELTSVIDSTIK